MTEPTDEERGRPANDDAELDSEQTEPKRDSEDVDPAPWKQPASPDSAPVPEAD